MASKFVAVHRHHSPYDKATVEGGVIIDVKIETPADWCDFYGVKVSRGYAVLFKAVEEDWRGGTKTAITYKVGEKPVADDFDPTPSCGGGLHLSPHPRLARDFCPNATHYLACKVKVADIVVIDAKVKVRTCTVLHEVSLDGKPFEAVDKVPA